MKSSSVSLERADGASNLADGTWNEYTSGCFVTGGWPRTTTDYDGLRAHSTHTSGTLIEVAITRLRDNSPSARLLVVRLWYAEDGSPNDLSTML